jgi:hypothetical protein
MADAQGRNSATLRRIWGAHGAQTRRVETFKLSLDPQSFETLTDIMGLCVNLPDKAIVLCVDEKG